jgi:glycosyltransferase involved in cell wall biosynthesis
LAVIFAWLNKRDWKRPGPIVTMAVQNAHALAKQGHETHLFVGAGEVASDIEHDLREFYGLEPIDTLRVHRFERWRIGHSRLALPIYLRTSRAIRQLAQRGAVAVVTRDATFLPLLAQLRRRLKVRAFYEAHDFYADLSWRTDRVKPGDRRQGWLERTFLQKLDGLICLTSAQRDLYAKVLPQVRSCAIPLGASDFPEPDAEHRRNRRTLAYVGRLSSDKGLKVMLKALPQLAANNIRLACFGGWEPHIAQLKEKLKARGLEQWVEFAPFRAPLEFQARLGETASVGLALLQDGFYNRYLTCPVKVLDYLSHGLPIIGSDLPSVQETAGNAAAYIKPDDSAELVRQVTKLLDDSAAYQHAASLSRARARELSWPNRAAAIVRLVQESG